MPLQRNVEVVPHSSLWRQAFAEEAAMIANVMDQNIVDIHHIGSTAIPGIYAKPIIDLLVEVVDIEQVDQQNAAMAALGYEAMGEYGIPGRRFFRKDNPAGKRIRHVHTFQTNSPDIKRHLAFRDYMIAHPSHAQQYSELKRQLANQHPTDIEKYMDGKDDFVKAMEQNALAWYRG